MNSLIPVVEAKVRDKHSFSVYIEDLQELNKAVLQNIEDISELKNTIASLQKRIDELETPSFSNEEMGKIALKTSNLKKLK